MQWLWEWPLLAWKLELDSSSSSSSDDCSEALGELCRSGCASVLTRSRTKCLGLGSAHLFWLGVPGTSQLCKHVKYTDLTNKKGCYQ